MKFKNYIASKTAQVCFILISITVWGGFAYLVGANAVLLWGSVIFFALIAAAGCTADFLLSRRRFNNLRRQTDGLAEKYLLGELAEIPYDAVRREYYYIMKEISRSAIGAVEDAKREKEEYFDCVEKWIHEIKTPLTACALICDNGGDIVKMRRELKKADNLTDLILQYARLRSAQNATVITEFNVADAIKSAIVSQRELLNAANIKITASGGFTVRSDENAFCFIIKQLLINCAKHCRGCKISIDAGGGKVKVRDSGAGIAAHDLPRIFERGFTGSGKGTGMGLYIVNELCSRLAIKAEVESGCGGTVFTFTF